MKDKIYCKDCKWWSENMIECHRHIWPRALKIENGPNWQDGFFIKTSEYDWCGDAEPKDK